MSFNYVSGVPAASNNPSTDQPNMLINTNSIPALIAVDHVSFGVANGGTHKQVTFVSNNVPSVPTSPPVLFTNTVAGLPQLFFYSGDAAHSSTQYVQAAAGSTFLLGGIIVKWGSIGLTADGTTITFPVAFPNSCYNVQLTISDSTQKQAFLNVSAKTTAGFTVRTIGSTGAATSIAFNYLAIGN